MDALARSLLGKIGALARLTRATLFILEERSIKHAFLACRIAHGNASNHSSWPEANSALCLRSPRTAPRLPLRKWLDETRAAALPLLDPEARTLPGLEADS